MGPPPYNRLGNDGTEKDDIGTIQGRIFHNLEDSDRAEKVKPGLLWWRDAGHQHGEPPCPGLYAGRMRLGGSLVFANFSEQEQHLPFNLLRLYGLNYAYRNLLSGEDVSEGELILEAYKILCSVG